MPATAPFHGQKNRLQAITFPRHTASPSAAPAPPTPLPKRPKGQLFFGFGLAVLVAFATYQIWNSFFRYTAFGIVDGRTLQISPTFEGVLRQTDVHEGDVVHEGQLLMTLDNFDLRQRESQLTFELKTAQATLEAETAKLRWQASYTDNQAQKAELERYETEGKLVLILAQLDVLRADVNRGRQLFESNAISAKELQQLETQLEGLEKSSVQLKQALTASQSRFKHSRELLSKDDNLKAGLEEAGQDQIKPQIARLQSLQADLEWVHQKLEHAQIRAPVSGTIVKIQRLTGEYCKQGEPLVTILEDDSLQIILYLPQHATSSLTVGHDIDVVAEPNAETISCQVQRLGVAFDLPPSNIERHYTANEKLLPFYLKPKSADAHRMALRVGEVVKLPRFEQPRTSEVKP